MSKPDTDSPRDALNTLTEYMNYLKAQNAKNPNYRRLGPAYEVRCREWAGRDYWTVEEAANLLSGTDPERPFSIPGQTELEDMIKRIRASLLRADIKHGGKSNKMLLSEDVIRWAKKKRLSLPAQLLGAMGEHQAMDDRPAHGNTVRNETKRQAILGAAVTALVKYPHKCKDRGGKYTGHQIATVLEQHQTELFEDKVAPFSIRVMAQLINKYLPA